MDKAQQFEHIISGYSEEVRQIASAAREKIYAVLPGVVEIVWEKQRIAGYGTGPKKMSEHFSWIQPNKKHVNLGFNYGVELPDPNGLLEGTGKKFRHIKLRSPEDLERPGLEEIIRFATTHRVPPLK